jgi:DNA-binding CsgD family transcriptional regulator
MQGLLSSAGRLFRESLGLAVTAGDQWRAAGALEGVAAVAAAQHQPALALRLAGAAAAIRDRLHAPLSPALRKVLDDRLASARAEVGIAGFTRAWAQGRHVRFEELAANVEGVVSTTGSDEAPADELAQLTPRERQVAVLVARGLRNRDIADQLGMQPKTAERHVGHLLEKLGMSSRVQVAVWALRQGLVQEQSPP